MNKILKLNGQLRSDSTRKSFPSQRNLPKSNKGFVTSKHINRLIGQLEESIDYWSLRSDVLKDKVLISVHYSKLVAKSNRLKYLLGEVGDSFPDDFVVGSRYDDVGNSKSHIVTYLVSIGAIKNSINDLKKALENIENNFNSKVNYVTIEKLKKNQLSNISKSRFAGVVVDSYYVSEFKIDEFDGDLTDDSIISLYKTDNRTIDILNRVGLSVDKKDFLSDTTVFLTNDKVKKLKERAPYLISMGVTDLSNFDFDGIKGPINSQSVMTIPSPVGIENNNYVGVIDTLFCDDVYFSEWVESFDMTNHSIPYTISNHGTAVTSIIVDGPQLNPDLDDGCGRFKVKHFGVTGGGKASSFAIIDKIQKIIKDNPEIKVWNLSLGSDNEINKNFMSVEASVLDEIQYKNDVIFVISGTNDSSKSQKKSIGAPADSLNSIVVNSTNLSGDPASYSRCGPVLSFYNKPDVCYYGGDGEENQYINACGNLGGELVTGTSFSAPWITRKVAFLIYKMGLSREIAKALIIDSSADWDSKNNVKLKGFGEVPLKIEDVLSSDDDEIKFFLQGTSKEYKTFAYNIPVPLNDDEYHYSAKATLCYFSEGDRNKGVDYSNTELDIRFGRIKSNGKLQPINNDFQGELDDFYYEKDAKRLYRKWDNVKHISEKVTGRAKTSYGNDKYGIEINHTYRFTHDKNQDTRFGIVITLKNIDSENRISEFIKLCQANGWIVNHINIEDTIKLMNKADVNIELEQ